MKQVLAIIGKRPIIGFSKTRLAKDVGDEKAFQLYENFITDFFKTIPKHYKIYFFGTPADEETKNYFTGLRPMEFFFQPDLPFFERLSDIFKIIATKEGSDCFIHLTGTDIPDFPFDELEKIDGASDVYIGPDPDGGYYYLGAKSYLGDVFNIDVKDGSQSVLEETLNLCQSKDYSTQLLKTWSDIDTLEDLKNSSLYTKYESILAL